MMLTFSRWTLVSSVQAKHLILRSSGAARTFTLAEQHSQAAIDAIRRLPESDARDALEKIARDVLTRKK